MYILKNLQNLIRKFKEPLFQIFLRPGRVIHLVGASCYTLKSCRFSSQSGHIPKLWIGSQLDACGRQPINVFLSHGCLSLSFSLSSQLKKTCPQVRIKIYI